MPQVVARIAKLKTAGQIAGALAHNARTRTVLNAQPAVEGGRCIALVPTPEAPLEKWAEIVGDQTVRSNAVRAVEIVLSASPEYFRPGEPEAAGQYDKQRTEQWVRANLDWLKQEWGDRLLSCHLHLDEATPHIQAVIIPLDGETGRLNCRGHFGGRKKMAEFQDRAAAAVAHLGIERGTEHSRAEHVGIRAYYNEVEARAEPIPAAPEPMPPRRGAELVPGSPAWRRRRDAEEQHRRDTRRRDRAKKRRRKQNEAKARATDRAQDQRRQYQETASDRAAEVRRLKAETDRLRSVDLTAVAAALGGEMRLGSKKSHNTTKWEIGGEHINISWSEHKWKWISNASGRGGAGAIDLVMHVLGVDFQGAVGWLRDEYGVDAATVEYHAATQAQTRAAVDDAPAYCPPANSAKYGQVVTYLTRRGIPRATVDAAAAAGLLHADARGNCVFPRQRGGAFVRGTQGRSYHRTYGPASAGPWRWDGTRGDDVYVTESVIDALAIRGQRPGATVIATAGNLIRPEQIEIPDDARRVYAAHDADAAGDAQAQALIDAHPGTVRARPPEEGQDWAESIRARSQSKTHRPGPGMSMS